MKRALVVAGLIGLAIYGVIWLDALITNPAYTSPRAIESPALTSCPRAEISKDNILILINEHRLANGRQQLPYSEVVEKYAQARADEIATTGKYTHDTTLGSFFDWQKKNVKKEQQLYTDYWNEVLMRGAPDACATVDAWKKSPTHNDGLLRTENYVIGIGVNGNVVTGQLLRIAEPKPQSSSGTTKRQAPVYISPKSEPLPNFREGYTPPPKANIGPIRVQSPIQGYSCFQRTYGWDCWY